MIAAEGNLGADASLGTVSTVVIFAVAGVVAGRYFIRDQTSLDVRFLSAPAGLAPADAKNR